MLLLVGLGLGGPRDISVAALDAVRGCTRVHLDAYTSVLVDEAEGSTLAAMEKLYGKRVIVADRHAVEQDSDAILAGADTSDVAFLVVGDPFGATTHTDLAQRARARSIPVRVFHNASVLTAVGACGLSLYQFGQTVSLVYFTESWRPDSFYDRVGENARLGLHTLCLLDIRVREPTVRSLARGLAAGDPGVEYEPPRFMSVNEAARQLLEVEATRGEGLCGPETLVVGLARLGAMDQCIRVGTLGEFAASGDDNADVVEFGRPLHTLVIVGSRLHEMEVDFMRAHAVDPNRFDVVLQRQFGLGRTKAGGQ